MSKDNQSSDKDVTNFLSAKNSMLTYYQNMGSAQAVRLIGFSAGLFTLLGIIQLSSEQHLRLFFKDAPSIINFGITSEGLAIINFIFLFISVGTLTFLICRAIFRYTAYSIIASDIIYITLADTTKTECEALHSQISEVMIERVAKKYPKRLYGVFHISWFFSFYGNNNIWKGLVLSLLFSFFSTCLLLLLIW